MLRYRYARIIQMGLSCLGLLILLMAISTGVTIAQEDLPDVDTSGVTADEVNDVAKEVWCPLCSGVRLDSCELKACDQMKEVIAIKLAQGEDAESIKAYFLEQYGPQVLGEPPREGFNWLAWILPPLALVLGGVFVWMRSRKLVRPDAPAAQDAPRSEPEQDVYEQRLEEELEQYG